MTARQFVWSDPKVQSLAEQFVVVADDGERLGNATDAESLFFQKIWAAGSKGHTQGTYFFTPSGVLLVRIGDSVNPRTTVDAMHEALRKWNDLSEPVRMGKGDADMVLREKASVPRNQEHYPKGGLILRCSCRDLPRTGRYPMADRWNEDFAWFRKEEARQFLPTAPRVGDTHDIPSPLVKRLARFHLVDQVRGQVAPFSDENVKNARITVHITKVRGSVVSVELKGETLTSAEGRWGIDGPQNPTWQKRGYDAQLLGQATYDLRKQEFVTFKMVAVGSRWGGTEYNLRSDDLESAPMGVAFTLAEKGRLQRFQPGLIWAYDH